MKVSELSRIANHIVRFEAIELTDGYYCMNVHWWSGSNIETERLYAARGGEKIFKSANAIFSFLRSIGNYTKLEISFLS